VLEVQILKVDLDANFACSVHKNRHLIWPRADTPTHYIAMGFSKDLKEATTLALRDMIAF
jgi:acetamidase/formamidase